MEQQKSIWLTKTYQGTGERCDTWLTQITGQRRTLVQKWFTHPGVYQGEKLIKPSHKLQDGAVISILHEPNLEPEPLHLAPISMPLDILFEDEHLIVVNKPAGLSVHPGAGAPVPTLLHGLLAHGLDGGDAARPGIVHRLDKDTTGVLVAAKNIETHAQLSLQFAEKTNQREYLALLDGRIPSQEINVENHLYRDPHNRLKFTCSDQTLQGKWSSSHFQSIHIYAQILTLAKVILKTGRTHQIRVHSSSIKAPIVGDQLYGNKRDWPQVFSESLRKLLTPPRQMLHAHTLGFQHPVSKEELSFTAPLPSDFQELLDALKPFQRDP